MASSCCDKFVGAAVSHSQPVLLTLAHSTCAVQGAFTPGGGCPRRLTLTTDMPVLTASSVTRLPTNPLPPKMTSLGGPA